MTPSTLIKTVSKEFGILKKDVEVLHRLTVSDGRFELETPNGISTDLKTQYEKAHARILELLPQAESFSSQLTERINNAQEISIKEVVQEIQNATGNIWIKETGIWGSDLSKDEYLKLICKLYATRLKTRRIEIFLEWAIADACNMSHALHQNLDEIVDVVSATFKISAGHLKEACRVAKLVPVHLRIPGWTHDQYSHVIRYAPALGKERLGEIMKTLAMGRERVIKLSCGITAKTLKPLTAKQVQDHLLKELRIKKHTRKNPDGFLYISGAGVMFSKDLDRKATRNPFIKVVDLSRRVILKYGEEPQELPEYDPSVAHFASSMLGLNQ